ncbi:MAG: hypothetical protein WBP61_15690 [Nocardioides sp.]
MREIMHGVALTVILAVAALCTLVQLSDADQAIDRLRQDDSVVQQVSSDGGARVR